MHIKFHVPPLLNHRLHTRKDVRNSTIGQSMALMLCALITSLIAPFIADAQTRSIRVLEPERLNSNVNSRFLDLSPDLSADGSELYYIECRSPAIGCFAMLSRFDEQTDSWGTAEEVLDTPFTQGGVTISPNGLELYLTDGTWPTQWGDFHADNTGGPDLLVARRNSSSEAWGEPERLSDIINSDFNEVFPNLSPDGLELYFASNRPSEFGDSLWVARRDSLDVAFSRVEIVETVNTSFDEGTSAISEDGLTLIFASTRPGGYGSFDLWASTRTTVGSPWSEPFNLGPSVNTSAPEYFPSISPDGRTLYYSNRDLMSVPIVDLGDVNLDGNIDALDIDALTGAIATGANESVFDLDLNGIVNETDRTKWIKDLTNTFFGDSNLDGEFNSSDLIGVFKAGEYEDNITHNSTWAEGDWNGDGDFESGDLITAFQDGGYELGPRVAVATVPEPSNWILLSMGMIGVVRIRKR